MFNCKRTVVETKWISDCLDRHLWMKQVLTSKCIPTRSHVVLRKAHLQTLTIRIVLTMCKITLVYSVNPTRPNDSFSISIYFILFIYFLLMFIFVLGYIFFCYIYVYINKYLSSDKFQQFYKFRLKLFGYPK